MNLASMSFVVRAGLRAFDGFTDEQLRAVVTEFVFHDKGTGGMGQTVSVDDEVVRRVRDRVGSLSYPMLFRVILLYLEWLEPAELLALLQEQRALELAA